jgi:hypothetical protein
MSMFFRFFSSEPSYCCEQTVGGFVTETAPPSPAASSFPWSKRIITDPRRVDHKLVIRLDG